MGTLLQLRMRVYGEPVARASEWGRVAKKILERSGWSDDDVTAIADNWHPGLMENGVPRWATLKAIHPPAGNAIRGHPALYLQWEQAGGKLDQVWQRLPGFEDISGKERFANFELITAALLVDQCWRLQTALETKRSATPVADETIWRCLFWAARFHANLCRVQNAAKGARGGRPKKAATRNGKAKTSTSDSVAKVTVEYDSLRIRNIAARFMATKISQKTNVSAPTVRKILDQHRPNWRS